MKALIFLLSSTQSSCWISTSSKEPPILLFLNLLRLLFSCSRSSAMLAPISIFCVAGNDKLICHTTSLWPADIKATCVVTDFLQSFRQFDLSLYLGPKLLHPPEVLHHLSPHDLYDGGGEGEPEEDVDGADHHVETFVCNTQSDNDYFMHSTHNLLQLCLVSCHQTR